MSQESGSAGANETAACSRRLSGLLPRLMRGLRRHQEQTSPATAALLGPRHTAALQHLLAGPITVGDLSARLGLTLPTVSGVVADLDRTGFVRRRPDDRDRRRTLVEIPPEQLTDVNIWLAGTIAPLSRVLERLTPEERNALIRAMDLFDEELANAGEAITDSREVK